jgi:hypothetical protein
LAEAGIGNASTKRASALVSSNFPETPPGYPPCALRAAKAAVIQVMFSRKRRLVVRIRYSVYKPGFASDALSMERSSDPSVSACEFLSLNESDCGNMNVSGRRSGLIFRWHSGLKLVFSSSRLPGPLAGTQILKSHSCSFYQWRVLSRTSSQCASGEARQSRGPRAAKLLWQL